MLVPGMLVVYVVIVSCDSINNVANISITVLNIYYGYKTLKCKQLPKKRRGREKKKFLLIIVG